MRRPSSRPPYTWAVELLAHGGTAGLLVELAPLVVLVVLGLAVWRRSRGAGAADDPSAPDDEARVEEHRGDGERGGRVRLAEPEEGAPGGRHPDAREDEGVAERAATDRR